MSIAPAEQLRQLTATKSFFIGIDSDGCAFDTMEVKHKQCFCPNFIHLWGLDPIAGPAKEAWEFVNLYSRSRGLNRFLALRESIMLLANHPGVADHLSILPDLRDLDTWIASETKLGEPALERYASTTSSATIARALEWSRAVNRSVAKTVHGISPFPFMQKSLEKMAGQADIIVVSQTPLEALEREWKEHDIDRFVRFIAGQEHGTKTEHIELAAGGKYAPGQTLMIGDAPGDREAAIANGIRFFPIVPGLENASWERFYTEALDRFLNDTFDEDYQKALTDEFNAHLPETPPWSKTKWTST
jgi:phosphoglycolate phosphatase-like HAD superfamily hydrolase